jgi:hypothetical protein
MSLFYKLKVDLYYAVKVVEDLVCMLWFFATNPLSMMVLQRKAHHDEYRSADDIQKYNFYKRLNAHPIPFPLPFAECTRVLDIAETEDSFRYVYFYCGESLMMKETYSPIGFLLIREIFSSDEQWCVRFHFFWDGKLRTIAMLKDDDLIDDDDTPSIQHFDQYGFLTSRTWSTPLSGSPIEEFFNIYGELTRTVDISTHKSAHFYMEDVCENEPPGIPHYCIICLTADDSLHIKLSKCCNQFLHKSCFAEWIKKKVTCPICRFDFSTSLKID